MIGLLCATVRPDNYSCTHLAPAVCERDRKDKKVLDTWTCTDQQCRTLQTNDTWFCYGEGAPLLDYPVRVQAPEEGATWGQKEDNYAACVHARLSELVSRTNCRDYRHYTCEDCVLAYKLWLCAVIFPRCQDGLDPEASLVKPCHAVCNNVIRRCTSSFNFFCPKEEIDYENYDAENIVCNTMGLDEEILKNG
ncbi:hypothetical protein CYMTET_14554 [Cymbomonas tetramitiformis]|uniref:FZ domain-containing protein n=1 Tax=Cymbomonas tetramitiformis TaxID=36881 RepID=A0AAE0GG56_9CHLO|nr:hypothetical protein CYMTET_14554 [Cymbomonas tetramitiformis]